MLETVEKNKTIVRDFIEECWNQGKLDLVDDYIAVDCFWRGRGPLDPGLMKRAISAWRTAFPDFTYHVQQLVAEDDLVIAVVIFTGTHQGVFQRYRAGLGPWEPTGRSVDVEEVLRFRLTGGKAVEFGNVWDQLEFTRQLGVSPAPT